MFWYACTFFAVLACVRVVTFWYGRTAHSSKKVLRKCLKMDNFVQTIQNYMERVRLTKEEKAVLRMLQNTDVCPTTYPKSKFNGVVRSLQRKGLVRGFWSEEEGLICSVLTDEVAEYLATYPRLTNPINWGKVGAVAACISVLLSVLAMLVACSVIFK